MVRRGAMLCCALVLATCGGEPARPPPSNVQAALKASPTPEDARTWSFDDSAPGSMPAGLARAETLSVGTPATWAVVADPSAPSPPHAFGVTKTENVGGTLNLALVEDAAWADVEVDLALRAVGGHETVGGGLVWRLRDTNNYYVARWKRGNVRVYVVDGGHRTRIASADVDADPDAWHTLSVAMESDRIEIAFDGVALIEVMDTTHAAGGRVGLWTQADAVTSFDDLRIRGR